MNSNKKLSKEEIEQFLKEMTKVRPELLDKNALKLYNTIMKILDKNNQLESNNQKLIEKLEKDKSRNNKFDFYPLQAEKAYNNYYKLGKIDLIDEILEILKGEGI